MSKKHVIPEASDLATSFRKRCENHDYHSRERYMHAPYSLCHVHFTSVGLHACRSCSTSQKAKNKGKCHYPSSVPSHPQKYSTFSEWEGTEDIGNGSLGPRLLPSHILCATKAAWGGAWE